MGVDEKTLRETKDDLMERVTQHQRYEGKAQPDVRAAEDFLDPILHRVDVDHDKDKAIAEKKKTANTRRNKELKDGDDYGKPNRSTVTQREGEKVSVFTEEIGDVILKGDGTISVSPEVQAAGIPRHTQKEHMVRSCIRAMWQLPEWKYHLRRLFDSNINEDDKRKGVHLLLRKWIREYQPAGQQLVL